MARNTSLGSVLAMLKGELGYNQVVGVAAAQDTELCTLISNKQQWLASEYDWPFLEHRWDSGLSALNRYVTFPTTDENGTTNIINHERPVTVEIFWSNKWQPVQYGIGSQEFNYRNSDLNPPDQLDPVQRWRFDDEGKFEIWPIPASSQTLRFTGQRVVVPLVSFTPVAGPPAGSTVVVDMTALVSLDDQMVVLFAAAEKLKRLKQADADLKLQMATNRMNYIRASYPHRSQRVVFGNQNQPVNKVVPIRITGVA